MLRYRFLTSASSYYLYLRGIATSTTNMPSAPYVSATTGKGKTLPLAEEGLSPGLGGIGEHAVSITAFMKPASEKKETATAQPLPCDVVGSEAHYRATHGRELNDPGRLPSPRRPQESSSLPPHRPPTSAPSSLPHRAISRPAKTAPPTSSRNMEPQQQHSEKVADQEDVAARVKEAEAYYKNIKKGEQSKENMWGRIRAAKEDNAEKAAAAMDKEAPDTLVNPEELDRVRTEEDMRENDIYHYRVGNAAFPDDEARRQDYFAMWQLATALNKARWNMLEVQSQRGVKSTGAGLKLQFWKESIEDIMSKGKLVPGQFTHSHPVLCPFARAVQRHPRMTKAFVRGFTNARLRIIQQPGNVQQLFDHFDKFYGYFYNSLLEVVDLKDENAEHMMLHIGRATGLTMHCVMFWKKYACLGFTMLPADLCADNHVNLALLKNLSLASRDRAVKHLLCDVMSIAKTEMLHAEKLAPLVDPKTWPIAMECSYPNYYLDFLQRREFNVSAMFADYNIDNPGLWWYRQKKSWEWARHQSIERLVRDTAPLPFIRTSWHHRGSQYKIAADQGSSGGKGQ